MSTPPNGDSKFDEKRIEAAPDQSKLHLDMNEMLPTFHESLKHRTDAFGNLVYENVEEEPELSVRTYVALAAMFLFNYVQVVALQGPPAVVRLGFYPLIKYCESC